MNDGAGVGEGERLDDGMGWGECGARVAIGAGVRTQCGLGLTPPKIYTQERAHDVSVGAGFFGVQY